MIPLIVDAEFDDRSTAPFVARLGADNSTGVARLSGELDNRHFYQHGNQTFALPAAIAETMKGDVVFADPATNKVHRWLRANSHHNTLLVTERCDQLCQMCSQPPRKTHVDMFSHLREACLLADEGIQIGFSGGEPLLYKDQLFSLLEDVGAQRPDLSFHILTNGQHFDADDAQRLKHPIYRQVTWGIPLYSFDPETHDEIVAKKGAYARLMKSFSLLAQTGQIIELRTVLLRQNYAHLPSLAKLVAYKLPFIATWAIMQMERAGFARTRWAELFEDHSANLGPLTEAVSIARARKIDTTIFNTPYCTVNDSLRPYLRQSISDWKKDFPPECKTCTAKSVCAGFFTWHASLSDYKFGGPVH